MRKKQGQVEKKRKEKVPEVIKIFFDEVSHGGYYKRSVATKRCIAQQKHPPDFLRGRGRVSLDPF